MKRVDASAQGRPSFVWTPERMALLELLADVTDRRTKAEKAKEAGLSETHACKVSKRPEFIAALVLRVREVVKSELPDVYAGLTAQARKGDVQAARTILQAAGEIQNGVNVSTVVSTTTGGDLGERLGEHHKRRFERIVTEN